MSGWAQSVGVVMAVITLARASIFRKQLLENPESQIAGSDCGGPLRRAAGRFARVVGTRAPFRVGAECSKIRLGPGGRAMTERTAAVLAAGAAGRSRHAGADKDRTAARPAFCRGAPALWRLAGFLLALFVRRASGRRRILWLRSGRQPVRAARPDHAGECRPADPGLDLPYRRSREPRRRRAEALEIRGHADSHRRQAHRLHAVQCGDRARPRHGARAVALRPQNQDRLSPRQPVQLPRRGGLARSGRRGRAVRRANPDRDRGPQADRPRS